MTQLRQIFKSQNTYLAYTLLPHETEEPYQEMGKVSMKSFHLCFTSSQVFGLLR